MNEHPKYYITYMKFHADAIHDSATVIHKEKMMNERIKLLWEEAAKTTQGDSWEEQTKFMERYTELIVRECVAVCDAYGMPDGTSYTAMVLSDAIKRKFGIDNEIQN